jgi:hypothetical protein
MTPTHTNKSGVRYLYYVSQAALRKPSPPGSIARVPGPESEALVIDVLSRGWRGRLRQFQGSNRPLDRLPSARLDPKPLAGLGPNSSASGFSTGGELRTIQE